MRRVSRVRETDCCVLTQQSVSCCGFLWKDDILHIVHKETADIASFMKERCWKTIQS